jgi:hypothetical protein
MSSSLRQFLVLLAQRGLAGGDRVLRLDAGVEQVFEVGVLVGEDVPLDACLGGQDTMVSLPSDRSGVPFRSLSMAASISRRSSAAIVTFRDDAGAGVAFGDLLQHGGAAGKALADRAGQERAG